MSVVVRMEMPENCLKCPLRNQCEIFCDWFGSFGTQVMRKPYPKPFDKGCHIICSLPEGHGRLIDADAAVKDIQYEIFEYKMDGLKGTPMPTEHLGLMKNWIADEDICPTIVPAERRET